MNEERYQTWVQEFERQLHRPLDDKEKIFTQWLVSREQKEERVHKTPRK